MAAKTRVDLNADNAALFVNNTTGNITPAEEKVYNEDVNDSAALLIDDNDFTGINTHTKEVRWHKGAGLTAATALALGNTGNYHHVTGDTEIETLTTKQHGTRMLLYFEGKPNLKDSANLLLGGGQDIQTNAGSSAEFISEGSGVWRLINYKTGYQSSGTYSPTFTDSVDMVTTLLSPMTYTSVGNIATVYFNVSIELSNSATQGDTIWDVPILPVNDFSDAHQAFGAITPITWEFTTLWIQSKGSSKTVQINFTGATANSTVNLKGSFSYNLDN